MSSSPLSLLDFTGRMRLSMIRQSEAAECGPACLAMVAGYHGHRIDISTMRRRAGVSLKGATLETLIGLAARFHLSARPVRLEMEELVDIKTPAILHWDMSHFVVLKRAGRRHIDIHDPARGPRRLRLEEAADHFTGVAMELTPTAAFQRRDETEKLKLSDFWRQVRGLRRFLLHAFMLAAILQAFALASPFYTQLLIDEALQKMDAELIGILAAGFGLLMLLQTVTGVLRRYVGLYLGTQLNFQVISGLFHHLIRLPADWFGKRHIGDIVSRFSSLQPVQSAFTTGVVSGLLNVVAAVAALVMLLIYSPALTALVVGVLLVYLGLRAGLFRYARQLQADQIVANAREDSTFMESLRAIEAVKIFGRETQRESVWQNQFAEAVNAGIRREKLGIWTGVANTFLFGAQNIAVLYFGAHMVMDGQFTIGMLMAYMSYKGQFEGAAIALVDGYIAFRMLDLHLERLADVGLAEREPGLDPEDSVAQDADIDIRGEIELRDVSFRYAEGEPWVLSEASLRIAPGEFLALIGPSGSGKTTLLKLMMGLLEPTKGEILIDGRPLSHIGRQSYRNRIAAVMQEDSLLSGRLLDNIAFFDPAPDEKLARQCARAAGIHREIMTMPMGYKSLIGDMGSALSGGQKQRLLLARALYRQPRILFLDEGTANLDPVSERRVLALLQSLVATRISIAHRQAMMQAADRVCLLDGGRVRELDGADLTRATA